MKKICLFMSICISLVILVNASPWEGSAAVAAGNELPQSGLYIATNSFPVNTAVDITNPDNGKTTRVTAFSTLDTPGVLALLSKDAANAIGFDSNSSGRISMVQSSVPAAVTRYAGGQGSGDPDNDPAAFAALSGYDSATLDAGDNAPAEATGNSGTKDDDRIVNLDDNSSQALKDAGAVSSVPTDTAAVPAPLPAEAVQAAPGTPPASAAETSPGTPAVSAADASVTPGPDYQLSLTPADIRPPEGGPAPDTSKIIPEISSVPPNPSAENSQDTISPANPDFIDPSLIIDPVREAPVSQAPVNQALLPGQQVQDSPSPGLAGRFASDSVQPDLGQTVEVVPPPVSVPDTALSPQPIFSAPLIGSLEKGRYYLQIGAYSKAETVQSEIAKISDQLPLVIMNTGDTGKPVYRILIGPVNLGESGALLQRFKATYRDAFVRLGN